MGMIATRAHPSPLSIDSLFHPICFLTTLTPRKTPPPSIHHRHRPYTAITAATATPTEPRKEIVFLGTPEVAALVLKKLLDASNLPDATFNVSAVVSQPGRPKGRSRHPTPTPVETLALQSGLAPDQILCPERATDPVFLDTLAALAPDLCITAAYGNYLPTTFLSIPRYGTLNIHPSLLPKYRGAAPVQRTLQDGVAVTGVSLLYTVKAMDAGPILAQQKVPVSPDIQAPELLHQLFSLGTDLLLKNVEVVWAGMAETMVAQPQDESKATHAPKISREEGLLDFNQPAIACHNKVRAFVPWPGAYHTFRLMDGSGNDIGLLELKIVRTRVGSQSEGVGVAGGKRNVVMTTPKGEMKIVCGDGHVLELLEVQAPGRKVVAAKDFVNGLKGNVLTWGEG